MDKFKKQSPSKENFLSNDDGIEIKTLLTLIEQSEYYDDLLNYFKIKSTDDTKINIKGGTSLYNKIKNLNKRFIKLDLISNLKDITFDYTTEFGLVFHDLTNNEYLNNLGITSIKAYPIHSAQRDFFSNLYDIDKYAYKLISKGFKDILDQNLAQLKTKNEHIRKYRLMHDIEDNTFYVRAIISQDRYFNYDNSLTVVIALLKLHFEMSISNVKYELHFFEYNESFIQMYFETSETEELKGIGLLKNTIQISNDEIKREALKFSNVCSIGFKDSKQQEQSLFIKPKDIKTKVLSITHGTGPIKAFKNLENFVKSKENFENLSNEIQTISSIKNHNQILYLVKSKIEASHTDEIKKYKNELSRLLLVDIKNTTQLLETFNKLIYLEGLEIDAKEYLRYLIYEALIERK